MKPALAVLSILLIGHITDKASPLRRLLLKGYAYERSRAPRVPLWVSRLTIMKRAWFRSPSIISSPTSRAHAASSARQRRSARPIALSTTCPINMTWPWRRADAGSATGIAVTSHDRYRHPQHRISLAPESCSRTITGWSRRKTQRRSAGKCPRDGMIQSVDRHLSYRGGENYFVVCNCCKESCVPIIAYRVFKDEPYAFYPSGPCRRWTRRSAGACGCASTPAPRGADTGIGWTPRARKTGARRSRAYSTARGAGSLRMSVGHKRPYDASRDIPF